MSGASLTLEAGVKIIWFVAAALTAVGFAGLFNAGVQFNSAERAERAARAERALAKASAPKNPSESSGMESLDFSLLGMEDESPFLSLRDSLASLAAGSLLVLGSFAVRRYCESRPVLDDDPPPRC